MLELIDLSRRYGDTIALDGLSFTVEPGQLFGFVGPSGAGKTTAMRIVLGVLEPDRGEVRWQGAHVTSFIPMTAPITMPARIALGAASPVEIAGALVVTLGCAALLIPLAGRIYSGAVLRTGSAVKLRDAWRAAG